MKRKKKKQPERVGPHQPKGIPAFVSMTDPTPARGRRTRALLKSYYGLSDHGPADPLDIGRLLRYYIE